MELWPFIPRTGMTEEMAWLTDVIRAKGQEQRISLRKNPRVTIDIEHVLDQEQYQVARQIMRDFLQVLMPVWSSRVDKADTENVKGVLWNGNKFWNGCVPWNGDDVCAVKTPVNECNYAHSAVKLVYWKDWKTYADADIYDQSATDLYIEPNALNALYVLPVFLADIQDGGDGKRMAAQPQQFALTAMLRDIKQPDGGAPIETYRGLELLTHCPQNGGSYQNEPISYQLRSFSNNIGMPEYSKALDYPDALYQWRWVATDQCELRKFFARRKGRQRAFWISDYTHSFKANASIAGTNLFIENNGYIGQGFDIEIVTDGAVYRRQVLSVEKVPTGYRLQLDSAVSATLASIKRISKLHCVRLNSDTVTFTHHAVVGVICSTTLTECPITNEA